MEPKKATILLTGGAGYIGSHTALELLKAGHTVVVLDNCSNCYRSPGQFIPESLHRVQELAAESVKFIPGDVLCRNDLDTVFLQYPIDCVVHFAGLKSVSDSWERPLDYYRVNVAGTLSLLDAMKEAGCRRVIFSSSATVYGNASLLPLDENSPTGNCSSPYGRTKFSVEQMLSDLCRSDGSWKAISLRYFNPVGAHESGRIGEDPNGVPGNLMPRIAQAASGKLRGLEVFGDDYETRDGTCVRDYIHVQDLADGHVKSLEKIFSDRFSGYGAYNLGTGRGYSVLEVISAYERASGRGVPHSVAGRRIGDPPQLWCDPSLANKELGWCAKRSLQEMCEDSWRWARMNPTGYRTQEPENCTA